MRWKCNQCAKYPEDPNPCYLERDTKEEINAAVECPFYGDMECRFEEVTDVVICKIRARVVSSYWKYLDSGKSDKQFLWGRTGGICYMASLFLAVEEIGKLQDRTEERFKRKYGDILELIRKEEKTK